MKHKIIKIVSLLLCLCLVWQQSGFAQVAAELNIAAHFAALRNSLGQDRFRPLHLRYLSYDNLNNNFQLLLDKGDSLRGLSPKGTVPEEQLKAETKALLSYFFIGISLPNDSFWVNLRPDSPDNIIDDALARTDVGRILLEADLQLKKDTAGFTSPETPEGKEYWNKLYNKAGELFGSENISIPTLTRPWIVPDEIIIRETPDNAYIYKATLKVMLEQDYLKGSAVYNFKDERLKTLNEYSSQLIRELIIPKLAREINTAKRYAPLRQAYYSLVLAQWFKQKFAGKEGLYSGLIDQKNLTGLTSKEPYSVNTYFTQYKQSFAEGEYNIKKPVHTPFGQVIRSYMSGGIGFGDPATGSSTISAAIAANKISGSPLRSMAHINPDVLSVEFNSNSGEIRIGGAVASPAEQEREQPASSAIHQVEDMPYQQWITIDNSKSKLIWFNGEPVIIKAGDVAFQLSTTNELEWGDLRPQGDDIDGNRAIQFRLDVGCLVGSDYNELSKVSSGKYFFYSEKRHKLRRKDTLSGVHFLIRIYKDDSGRDVLYIANLSNRNKVQIKAERAGVPEAPVNEQAFIGYLDHKIIRAFYSAQDKAHYLVLTKIEKSIQRVEGQEAVTFRREYAPVDNRVAAMEMAEGLWPVDEKTHLPVYSAGTVARFGRLTARQVFDQVQTLLESLRYASRWPSERRINNINRVRLEPGSVATLPLFEGIHYTITEAGRQIEAGAQNGKAIINGETAKGVRINTDSVGEATFALRVGNAMGQDEVIISWSDYYLSPEKELEFTKFFDKLGIIEQDGISYRVVKNWVPQDHPDYNSDYRKELSLPMDKYQAHAEAKRIYRQFYLDNKDEEARFNDFLSKKLIVPITGQDGKVRPYCYEISPEWHKSAREKEARQDITLFGASLPVKGNKGPVFDEAKRIFSLLNASSPLEQKTAASSTAQTAEDINKKLIKALQREIKFLWRGEELRGIVDAIFARWAEINRTSGVGAAKDKARKSLRGYILVLRHALEKCGFVFSELQKEQNGKQVVEIVFTDPNEIIHGPYTLQDALKEAITLAEAEERRQLDRQTIEKAIKRLANIKVDFRELKDKAEEFILPILKDTLQRREKPIGLVDVRGGEGVPAYVIPDIHGRINELAAHLFSKTKSGQSVLEMAYDGKLRIVLEGDLMNSERKEIWTGDNGIQAEYWDSACFQRETPHMNQEMACSLAVVGVAALLENILPAGFIVLKGNEDNVKNTEDAAAGNLPFGKFCEPILEGTLAKEWLEKKLDKDFIDYLALWQNSLPILMVDAYFSVAHTMPSARYKRSEIEERDGEAAWGLTWPRDSNTFVPALLEELYGKEEAAGKILITAHTHKGVFDSVNQVLTLNDPNVLYGFYIEPGVTLDGQQLLDSAIPAPVSSPLEGQPAASSPVPKKNLVPRLVEEIRALIAEIQETEDRDNRQAILQEVLDSIVAAVIIDALGWDGPILLSGKTAADLLKEIMLDSIESDRANHIREFTMLRDFDEDFQRHMEDLRELMDLRQALRKAGVRLEKYSLINNVLAGIETLVRKADASSPLKQFLDDIRKKYTKTGELYEVVGGYAADASVPIDRFGIADKPGVLKRAGLQSCYAVVTTIEAGGETAALLFHLSGVLSYGSGEKWQWGYLIRMFAVLQEIKQEADAGRLAVKKVTILESADLAEEFTSEEWESLRDKVVDSADIKRYLEELGFNNIETPGERVEKTVAVDNEGNITINGVSSSALKDTKGGIDLRALPIMTQPAGVIQGQPPASFRDSPLPPQLHRRAGRGQSLSSFNTEWRQIEQMLAAGIIPSTERIKEACYQQEDLDIDKVLACLAGILRLEEERVSSTEPALKEILVLLESDKPAGELQIALSKIAVPEKEPELN